MLLRVCLCSLSLSLSASTPDRCSRKPISAVIVQHNCFGSTWLSFLLDSLPCVQRIRQNGNADGSFRGSAAAMVEFVTPSAMPDPGLSPCTAAALPGRKLLPALVNYFISAPRRTARKWVVAMLLREPIFAAVCEARKAALANLARNESCANVHHPTAATCPLGLNFSWWQDPDVLYAKWHEHERALLELAELTAKLATKLGVPTIATVEYAQLACAHGALPPGLRRALGERSHTSERDASTVTSEKLSPSNPARAIRNLPEVVAQFERRNQTAVARRLLAANESCAGDLSTIDRRVWSTLSLASGVAASGLS